MRHNLESSCSEDIIIKPDCLPISPWWRKESKLRHQELQKWPQKPTQLVCKRVHAFSDSAPWCTYLLIHPVTVPSSALSIEDNSRFHHNKVTNPQLFSGCMIDKGKEMIRERLAKRIDRNLQLLTRVVPHILLQEQCETLEHDLLMAAGDSRTLCKEVVDLENKAIVVQKVQECFLKQSHLFLSWIQGIRNLKALNVDKEIQKNDWFVDYIHEELSDQGYEVTKSYSNNKYCLFGKSRPE